MKSNNNEPAFPFSPKIPEDVHRNYHGLTKEEYFAAKAMQGILSSGIYQNPRLPISQEESDMLAYAAIKVARSVIDKLDETSLDKF